MSCPHMPRPRDRTPVLAMAGCCALAGLAQRHGAPRLHGPFNLEARARAGFTADELAALVGPQASDPHRTTTTP